MKAILSLHVFTNKHACLYIYICLCIMYYKHKYISITWIMYICIYKCYAPMIFMSVDECIIEFSAVLHSLKLISLLSKKAWQSNLCIIDPIWESPRGPDTKKYGSCAKILSGSWYMSFPGFWYKLFGVLLQNYRGAATKLPGCCYKNYRGPMPGVSGIQPRHQYRRRSWLCVRCVHLCSKFQGGIYSFLGFGCVF